MASFTKDLRTDTLTIGLLHAVAWYVAYPFFINFLQVAGVFGEVLQTPFLALVAIVAAPAALMFTAFALVSLFLATVVAYAGAVVARRMYGYTLPHDSWNAIVNLGIAFSALCVLVFGVGLAIFPPEFATDVTSTAPPYLAAQHRIHAWLFPAGLALTSVVLSFVSATVTFLALRPRAHA